ncbi:MAG TPA: tyrosine-type recombinase/integrase, partial [Vicinamibacterales bacterium]|nr:tyrosine-type recombinase/integrase [Vicinamibacterales bacterium]
HSKTAMLFMMYTGLPPAQIERINPATDIDWQATNDDGEPQVALRRRPRRKGKGAKETWTQLEPPAVDALKQLIAIGVTEQGTLKRLDRHAMANAWRRACEKVIRQQLADREPALPHRVKIIDGRERYITTTRPYDLRHSILTHLLKESGNLAGVQEHAQHATPRQTMRYVGAAIPESARQVSKAIRGTLPSVKAKPAGTGRQHR